MMKVVRTKRVGIAEAKARLSEVLRSAGEEPIVIHNRGRDVAVVMGIEAYERLRAAEAASPTGMAAFMAEVAELREKHGGGADIPYERLSYSPKDPFRARRK